MTAFDTRNKTAAVPTLSFRKPLMAFSLLVFLIAAAGYTIFEQYKKSIADKEVQSLGAIADLKVAQIVSWRDNQRRRAEFFSHAAMFPDEVDRWLREGAPANARKQRILKVLGNIQKEQGYKTIFLLDRKGAIRAATNGIYTAGAEDVKLVMEGMHRQRVEFSDLRREDAQGKKVSISSVAPLVSIDEKHGSRIVAALLFKTDPDTYLYPMIQSWPTYSQSAETLLIERDGNDILFLNELRHLKETALSLRIPLTNINLPGARAILGQAELAEGNDYRGIPVVAALRRIPDTSWFMVAKMDKEEVFAPIYQLKKWSAGLVFVFAAFAVGLFFLWYKGAMARFQQLNVQRDAAIERELLLKHFEYLTRFANDMIIVGDETGRIVEVNERVPQAMGYSRDELLQMRIPDLHEPLDSQEVPGQFEMLATKGEMRAEGIYSRKDGSTFAVEISARSIAVEGKRYLHGIVSDISERKAAETLLRSSEAALAEFKYTLDQTLDCVFIFQPDTLRFTYVNEGAKAQVGFSEAELLQMTPMDIKPGMTDTHFRSMVQPLLDGSIPLLKFEMIHRHKDGHDIPVENHLQLVQKVGQASRFVSIVRDITERKQSEAELIEAKELAEQASRAKSLFLSHMSHELRTPLNSIIGFAEIIEMGDDDETINAHRDNLKSIIRSGWHLLRIIEDLLNLSAIEAGKIELNIENVNIGVCLQDCFELMEPLAAQKLIELNCVDNGWQESIVRADAFRLKQILINLLSNAIKFNKVGGSISVMGIRRAGSIRILISDTGTGIAEDDIPFVFQPFNRLSKRPYSIEGAGIGLSIAKQLIELMGGRIGVESIYYMGSKFWIELPATDTSIRPRKALLEQTVRADNHTRMLYIEDNPDHVRIVREITSRMENLSLITAHTPTLGLDMAWAQQPDIIFVDIGMPGMNGYEVLSLLQNNELTRNVPVIAISASANPAEIETGLRAGFRHYFTKPLNVLRFKNIVLELLGDKFKA